MLFDHVMGFWKRNALMIVTLLFIAFLSATNATRFDFGLYLRSGHEAIVNHNITRDVATFTHFGETWNNHGWLSNAIIYKLFLYGGFMAITIVQSAVIITTFAVMWFQGAKGSRTRHLVLPLAGWACLAFFLPRPQIVTGLLAAVTVTLVGRTRSGDKTSHWLMVPIMALWGNLHGGYVAGLIIIMATIIGELWDSVVGTRGEPAKHRRVAARLGAVWIASFAALALNPNGIARTYLTPFRTLEAATAHKVTEWLPPALLNQVFVPFLIMLIVTGVLLARNAKRPDGTDGVEVVSYLLFLALALSAARHIMLFVIVTTPILIRHADMALDDARNGFAVTTRRLSSLITGHLPSLAIILFLAVGIRIAIVTRPDAIRARDAETLPVDAVDWLAIRRPEGRVFNEYNWGSYLMWKAPCHPIFIDGRIDLHDRTIDEWNLIIEARKGCDEAIGKWDIAMVMVKPDRPIVRHLEGEGWVIAYRDESAVILEKGSVR
jgi:hypothetical protein